MDDRQTDGKTDRPQTGLCIHLANIYCIMPCG